MSDIKTQLANIESRLATMSVALSAALSRQLQPPTPGMPIVNDGHLSRTEIAQRMKWLFDHMKNGEPIHAIKEYRALSGVPLKEAKDAVMGLMANLSIVKLSDA